MLMYTARPATTTLIQTVYGATAKGVLIFKIKRNKTKVESKFPFTFFSFHFIVVRFFAV
jgi:hypothetical protein